MRLKRIIGKRNDLVSEYPVLLEFEGNLNFACRQPSHSPLFRGVISSAGFSLTNAGRSLAVLKLQDYNSEICFISAQSDTLFIGWKELVYKTSSKW